MIYAPRQTHSHSFYPLLPVLPVLAVGPTPLGPLVWSSFFIILHVICVAFLIFSHLFFRGRGLANFCFSIDNQMRVKFASLACWGHKFINRLTSDLHQKICSFIYGSTFGGPKRWLAILQANRIILRIINVFVFHMQIRLVLSSILDP